LRDIGAMSDEEFEKTLNAMPDGARNNNFFEVDENSIATHSVSPRDGETIADKKRQMAAMQEQFLESIGANMGDSFSDIRTKTQDKFDTASRQVEQRDGVRDSERDRHMFDNIQ